MLAFSLGFVACLLILGIWLSWPKSKNCKHKHQYRIQEILDLEKPCVCITCGEPLKDEDGNIM